jgi:hypothetical protein
MIVDKYGNYVRKFMWRLCGWDRVDISLTVHSRAILKIVKSMCNGILRPARDWEILNCRLVTQHYKMH